MDLIEYIKEARKYAIKKGIEVNSVFLNDKIKYCRGFYETVCEAFTPYSFEYPPMVLGLATYLTEDVLPDNYAFGLFKSHREPLSRDEHIKQQAREEMLDELREMTFAEVIEMLHSEQRSFKKMGR